jgi:hypothetical protein
MLDLFGLGKDITSQSTPAPWPGTESKTPSAKKSWGFWLALDSLAVLVFAGILAERTYRYWNTPTPESKPGASSQLKSDPPKVSPKPLVEAPSQTVAPVPPPEPPKAEKVMDTPVPAPSQKVPARLTTKAVDFTYIDPYAEQVSLLGAFLVRSGGRETLSKDSQGAWQTTVYLRTGATYHYRFEVIGRDGKKILTPKKLVDVP